MCRVPHPGRLSGSRLILPELMQRRDLLRLPNRWKVLPDFRESCDAAASLVRFSGEEETLPEGATKNHSARANGPTIPLFSPALQRQAVEDLVTAPPTILPLSMP